MAKVEMESKFESTKRKLQESYKNIDKVFFLFFISLKKRLETYNLIMALKFVVQQQRSKEEFK